MLVYFKQTLKITLHLNYFTRGKVKGLHSLYPLFDDVVEMFQLLIAQKFVIQVLCITETEM